MIRHPPDADRANPAEWSLVPPDVGLQHCSFYISCLADLAKRWGRQAGSNPPTRWWVRPYASISCPIGLGIGNPGTIHSTYLASRFGGGSRFPAPNCGIASRVSIAVSGRTGRERRMLMGPPAIRRYKSASPSLVSLPPWTSNPSGNLRISTIFASPNMSEYQCDLCGNYTTKPFCVLFFLSIRSDGGSARMRLLSCCTNEIST